MVGALQEHIMHGSQHDSLAIMWLPLQCLHLKYPPGQPSVQLDPYI